MIAMEDTRVFKTGSDREVTLQIALVTYLRSPVGVAFFDDKLVRLTGLPIFRFGRQVVQDIGLNVWVVYARIHWKKNRKSPLAMFCPSLCAISRREKT